MDNNRLKILKLKITNKKQYLYNLISLYDLTNNKVVKCSKELDSLILEYESHEDKGDKFHYA
ncbi:aspartyl-phosphate phosphatase Spo0E family protein [Clostridium oceanicum]|uniref:Aspartyl-phosphate phosphatase Spo0E family protein n=1 Tax=Clostridium oceanicum TaxID=1543 RepID=A0ABP3V0H3_9CLOT